MVIRGAPVAHARRLAATGAAAGLIVLGLIGFVGSARASVSGASPGSTVLESAPGGTAPSVPGVSLAIVSQTMTVGSPGVIDLVLELTGTVPDDQHVKVILYNKLASRESVRAVVGGARDRRTVSIVDLGPAATIARNEQGQIVAAIATGVDVDPTRLQLASPGLYPLGVALVDSLGTTRNEQLGFVERIVDGAEYTPLHVGAVVRIDGPPSLQPSGVSVITPLIAAQFDALISLLNSSPMAIDLAVRPELLDGLALSEDPDDQARLDQLVAAIGDRHRVLALPYVALDPSFAAGSGLAEEFTEQLRLGEDAISDRLGVVADRTVWLISEGLDDNGSDLLRDLGVRNLLTGTEFVVDDGAGQVGTGGRLGSIDGSSEDIPVLAAEPSLARLVDSDQSTVPSTPGDARFVAADVFGLGLEADGSGDRVQRSMIAVLDAPDERRVTALAAFAAALAGHPRATFQTPSDIVRLADRETAPSDRLEMVVASPTFEPSLDLTATMLRVDQNISSTVSMLRSGDQRARRWRALERVTISQALTESARGAYVEQLDGELGELRGAISLPVTPKFNLGGTASKIPLVLENAGATPLRVVVRLTSPNNKVTFPDNDVELTVAGRTAFEIPIKVRSSGQTPIIVQVLTPAGDGGTRELIGATRLSISTNILSGIGQRVTWGFLGVLVLWWIAHARKSHRAKRVALGDATSRHPATTLHDS